MTKFTERRKRMRMPKKDIVVFYHSNCTDGFSGAWAAWKKFGGKADYVAWVHQTPLPPLKGKELYFIDICPREDEVKRLLAANRRVTAIDHHVTAEAAVKMTDRYSYALEHSGAVLAWLYFHPGRETPKLLRYVEDHELFLKKMSHTDAVHAYLDLFNFEFRLWSRFARDFEKRSLEKKYVAVGKLILKHEQKLVERIVSTTAVPVEFFWHPDARGEFSDFGVGDRVCALQQKAAHGHCLVRARRTDKGITPLKRHGERREIRGEVWRGRAQGGGGIRRSGQ